MLAVFILLLSSLLILITLRQIITVNLVINDEFYVSFDFLFIKFLLFPFKNSRSAFQKKKAKRDKKSNISKKFNKGKRRVGLAYEILKRSDVSISELSLPLSEDTPSEYIIKSHSFLAVISAVIASLESNARTFVCKDKSFFTEGEDSLSVDVSFKTSLYDIVASLFGYKIKQRKTY